jgi:hypothetical protein
MLRSRRITIGGAVGTSSITGSSLSIVPKRNGPWIR